MHYLEHFLNAKLCFMAAMVELMYNYAASAANGNLALAEKVVSCNDRNQIFKVLLFLLL